MIEPGLIFITGFFTSLHCIGMCGPIVLAYSSACGDCSSFRLSNLLSYHLMYNGGRILSYTLLGMLVGFAGTTLSSVKLISPYISLVSGIIMIIFAVGVFGYLFPEKEDSSDNKPGVVRRIYTSLMKKQTVSSKFILGLLTPLLPCGMLYAVLLKAMNSGNSFDGAMTMFLFALGIAPALILMGSMTSFISGKLRKYANNISAGMIILLGVTLILRGLKIHYLSWF